jgi:DNA (cytosine-5)-methyltransferase 1
MNVLSLFDGMSCGQQALDRNGIKVDNYFASEIDKYAITVTMANYPNTKQLGSVVDVDGYSLPKIDLLIGGSPCQSFSFAGKRKGMATKDEQEILTLDHYLQLKSEGFEFEGQSYLFWEYMRLLYECKPKYFLLENVMMGEKWEKILSRAIGVNPIMINSSLLSAQNRQRLYWTNIGLEPAGLFGYPQSTIEQPKDKGILLKDVLESEVDEKYYLSEKIQKNRFKIKYKGNNIVGTTIGDDCTRHGERDDVYGNFGKMGCLNATDYKQPKQVIVHNNKRLNETLSNNKIENNCLIDSYNQTIHTDKSITISTRVSAANCTHVYKESIIRKLTPIECERLQTVKDNYTNHVSDSQRYKMLGNGWTVDVIRHILNYMKI